MFGTHWGSAERENGSHLAAPINLCLVCVMPLSEITTDLLLLSLLLVASLLMVILVHSWITFDFY